MAFSISAEKLLKNIKCFGTPLYVYDGDFIQQQFKKLTQAFEGQDVCFFYACKALTNINILKLILDAGGKVDCSSINEVQLALFVGFPTHKILYTSNGIDFEEIAAVTRLNVHINIDSLSNLKKFAQTYGNTYPVGIRIRPNIMGGGNLNISTGHDKSKFGIPIEHIPEVLKIVEEHQLAIQCLHLHTGSEIQDISIFLQGVQVLIDLLPNFPQVTKIDLGGGFKVAYKSTDKPTDITLLAQELNRYKQEHPILMDKQIWFEPGKYLVSEAGGLVAKVTVIKDTPTGCFASIDTGFNHLIRPMFYDAYHTIENISNPEGTLKTYTIVGNICETDSFATDRQIAEICEGDILLIHNAGAYGFEMSSQFNSRLRPAEVLHYENKAQLIRKRDSFEDLLKNQTLVV